jgi:hypothetical protein
MLSININKLRNEVELREQKKHKIFDKILELCYNRILNSNQKNDDYSCTYIVPNVVFGLPLYDVNDCVTFIINKLIDKGFDVVYAFPTTIHISWKPKNDKNDKYDDSQSRNNNYQLSTFNKNIQKNNTINKHNINNFKLQLQDKGHSQDKVHLQDKNNIQTNTKYKPINDYKNTDNIIYNTNDINLFQSKLDAIFD